MKNSEIKVNFLYSDTDGYLPFINNKQVQFGLILRKPNISSDDYLENYEVVEPVFVKEFIGGVKDVFTGAIYPYCVIDSEFKKKYVYLENNRTKKISSEYIVVSYKMFYSEPIKNMIKESNSNGEVLDDDAVNRSYQNYIYAMMLEELNKKREQNNTRTS